MTACSEISASRRARLDRHAVRERERAYARAHRIAERLQRVLLRMQPPEALPGLAVEGFYEAALDEATVGGDSLDAFALDGGRVALAVADASGKGLAAAERMAEVRFALRAFLHEHSDPGSALSCLNDFVCAAQRLGRRDDGTFVTLTLVILDEAGGEMACLCAGGEPPLVLRTSGTVEVVPICGPALGLGPAQGYAAAAVRLGQGDAVLLASDGLTEARPASGEGAASAGPFLGLEGLAHLAAQARGAQAPLSLIGLAVFEGARAFAGGAFRDDACLLVAQRRLSEAGSAAATGSHRGSTRVGDTDDVKHAG